MHVRATPADKCHRSKNSIMEKSILRIVGYLALVLIAMKGCIENILSRNNEGIWAINGVLVLIICLFAILLFRYRRGFTGIRTEISKVGRYSIKQFYIFCGFVGGIFGVALEFVSFRDKYILLCVMLLSLSYVLWLAFRPISKLAALFVSASYVSMCIASILAIYKLEVASYFLFTIPAILFIFPFEVMLKRFNIAVIRPRG